MDVLNNVFKLEMIIKKLNLPKVFISLIVLLVGYMLAKEFRKISRKALSRSKLDEIAAAFISEIVYVVVFMITISVFLDVIGLNSNNIVAIIGTIGLSIGLAIKDDLSNLASGVIILFLKPFNIGDYINIKNDIEGTVVDISLVNTKLSTIDGKIVFVPNSIIAENYVTNSSKNKERLLIVDFKIEYNQDDEKAIEILKNIMNKSKYILNKSNIFVKITDLDIKFVQITVRGIVKNSDYFDAKYEILQNVKREFDENKIIFAREKFIGI